jgi:hypothetical protein
MPAGDVTAVLAILELSGIPAIIQHQAVPKTREHVEVRLAVRRELRPDEDVAARRVIAATLSKDFAFSTAYCATIPRGPGGKYEEFRSEVDV